MEEPEKRISRPIDVFKGNLMGFEIGSDPDKKARRPYPCFFVTAINVAERSGFEPEVEVYPLHSLSRRAP
jgi:hypothetical protein